MVSSSLKRMNHHAKDTVVTILFAIGIWIFRFLSYESLPVLARRIGSLGFLLVKRYRNRVIENLNIAFGKERDSEKTYLLSKEIFFHLACTPLELLFLLSHAHPQEQFLRQIKVQGKENLDRALSKGNGAIALGMHLGSFILLVSRLVIEGYPCNLVINRTHFPKLWQSFERYHRISGAKPIYTKPNVTAVKKSLNCLRRNEILHALADEQQRHRGISTPFFGQQVFTSPGPAILSIKTGAPMLPMYVLRGNEMERTLVIESPVTIQQTGDEERDIELLTCEFTCRIEQIVRQYPSQWSWLNRRWKLPRPGARQRKGQDFSSGRDESPSLGIRDQMG
jgi:KDO2-lipid IV(A) lauroyltransferase